MGRHKIDRQTFLKEIKFPFDDNTDTFVWFLYDLVGLDVNKIADICDVSPGYVSNIIRDERRSKTVENEIINKIIEEKTKILNILKLIYNWVKNIDTLRENIENDKEKINERV